MLKDLRRTLAGLDKDDLLDALGVEQRRSSADKLVPALALFGAGVLVGVGVGLMLAPKSGEALRENIKERLTPEGTRTA